MRAMHVNDGCMDDRVSLGQVIKALARRRRMIALATFGTLVVVALVSLVLPQWYRARASILPPESVTATPDIIGIMRFAGVKPTQLPTVATQSDIYAAILKSNTIAEAVIDSLNLVRAFNSKDRVHALARLNENVEIGVTPEGMIEIAFQDRDKERAAAVANSYVRALDQFNRETNVTSAGRVRQAVEKRIVETRDELDRAENDLKAFKDTTGAAFISEQAAASIKTAADIYAKIAALDVELGRLQSYATDRSPEVIDLKLQKGVLEGKLAEMGYLRSGSTSEAGSLFPRFDAAPALQQRLADLTTQVEIKRSVYVALSEQYEQARIDEARDTPTIQVLDRAFPPPVRSKPKRKIMVGVATAAAFLISSASALYMERRRGAFAVSR